MSLPSEIASRFQIRGLLGEGGVGRVYRAIDSQTGQEVALKCLQPKYATEGKIRRRFMREARAFRRLTHPNIVKMYDYGEGEDSIPFISLEFIEGRTLASMREDDLGLEELLDITDDILKALAFAHAQGVYHRDVKPENVVVRNQGGVSTAILLDFGFARLEDDEGEHSKHDAFGTPLYMAPEQISNAAPVGPGVDIYSTGIILYEFLTGGPPFTGVHGMAVALKHLTDTVPPISAKQHLKAPDALKAVVHRALAKAPADRYATAADFRRALAEATGRLEGLTKEGASILLGEKETTTAAKRIGQADPREPHSVGTRR